MPSFLTPTVLWVCVIILSIVIEATSLDLTAIWFAVGALGALVLSLLGVGLTAQAVIFLLLSVALLIAVRPLAKKFMGVTPIPTNIDRLIGQTTLVTTAIDNAQGQGEVKIGGTMWMARSSEGTPISAGAQVRILEIVGVKVIVTTADVE